MDRISEELLLEGLDDYVGLWEFAPCVRRTLGLEEHDEIRRASMEVLRKLVGGRLFVDGDLAENGGFAAWSLSPEETLSYVEDLWNELGRAPDLGDNIPWFDLTEEGERLARSLPYA